MGQKTHPRGFRLGVIDTWDSQWYASTKSYANLLLEDRLIREFLKKKLVTAGISKIEIWRKAQLLQVNIIAARPGLVIGKGGAGIESLRKELSGMISRKDVVVQLNVLEVAKIDLDAQVVSEIVAQQLERRVAFKKAMKQAMQKTMRAGAKGIKIMVSGRLGGTDIARTEWLREGAIPLHTLRADIHYGFSRAETIFGAIGVKVWIYRGNINPGETIPRNIKTASIPGTQEENQEGRRRKKRRGKEREKE